MTRVVRGFVNGARYRGPICRYYYDGFPVFRDPRVPRVPPNGSTIHSEQLCENYQHVLEHDEFDVSVLLFIFVFFFNLKVRRKW